MKNGYEAHFKKMQNPGNAKPAPKIQLGAAKSTGRSEQVLVKELRQRMKPRANTQTHAKARSKTPWKLIGASAVGLLIAGVGLLNADKIDFLIKNVEVSLLGGTAVASEAPATQAPAAAAKPEAEAKPEKKAEYSQEEINHLSKLNERKKELDAREEELNRVEAELGKQKGELEKQMAELATMRKNISSVLEERVVADDKKVETLVQMYSNMKASQAAKIMETLDEDLAVEILGRMKKKNAAEIMNLVKAEKAQILSEKYAGYRLRTPAAKTDKVDDRNEGEPTTTKP